MKHQEDFCIIQPKIHDNAVYFARTTLLNSLDIVG